jgi:hypothetical protein
MTMSACKQAGCVKRTEILRGWIVRTRLLLMPALLGGCGGNQGPERVIVSGTVTFGGKPIPNGKIWFLPDRTSNAPTAVALIADGNFVADSHGGVPVGTHKVQIEAYQTASGRNKPGDAIPPTVGVQGVGPQYLPAKYNSNSQLTMTIQPGSRAITKNFDLTD